MLQTLSKNGPIEDLLPHLEDVEGKEVNDLDNNGDGLEDSIDSNFVPVPLPSPNEGCAIADALGRMQTDETPLMWPNIDGNPINEFQTSGYIACAFPMLYRTGKADLRSEHVRDIKTVEHLLKYKDGRFARHRHPRWRYFALNSQMRLKVYVKQSLNDK